MRAQKAPQMAPITKPLPNLAGERLCALGEKFKAMEVHDTLEIDVIDMCLVSYPNFVLSTIHFNLSHCIKLVSFICIRMGIHNKQFSLWPWLVMSRPGVWFYLISIYFNSLTLGHVLNLV